jgi:hypothetical protein
MPSLPPFLLPSLPSPLPPYLIKCRKDVISKLNLGNGRLAQRSISDSEARDALGGGEGGRKGGREGGREIRRDQREEIKGCQVSEKKREEGREGLAFSFSILPKHHPSVCSTYLLARTRAY